MNDYGLHLISVNDLLESIRTFVKMSRQNADLTQSELAHKAGVPATTISRLERTGYASTDALFRVLFALDELDAIETFLANRIHQLEVLSTEQQPRLRVRHTKEDV